MNNEIGRKSAKPYVLAALRGLSSSWLFMKIRFLSLPCA